MSIELRKTADGRHWECDWGVIENGEANPRRGLRHLVLTTADYTEQLLQSGPRPGPRGGIHSASRDGDRIFQHCDYDLIHTTWELFEAHFADHKGPHNLLIGRWPD